MVGLDFAQNGSPVLLDEDRPIAVLPEQGRQRHENRVLRLPHYDARFDAVVPGTPGKGQLCYRAACESPSDQRLHAWRRQVKYCAYQLEAVVSIGSKKLPGRKFEPLRRQSSSANPADRISP
jgi:hypothetical protein